MAPLATYFVDNLSPFVFRIGENAGVRWYGLSYVLGFILGAVLLRWLSRRGYCALPPAKVVDFITYAALFGVMLGGRLGYLLFYRLHQTIAEPLSIVKVWDGGMSSHGGIIGLVLFTVFYARRHRLSWLSLADNLAVVAPVGLFLGRCANFINGELYGRATTVPWAMQFPKELLDFPEQGNRALSMARVIEPSIRSVDVLIEQARHDPGLFPVLQATLTPRHPSQLYEALLEGAFLFLCLWFLRVRTKQPRGMLAGLFCLLYAAVRFIAENFREPDAPLTGPFTRGQALSAILVVMGVSFVAYARKTRRFEAAQSR
jgi:phosphatidylglycerol:prolipoprotein diacylglycerol transferase